MLIATLYIVDRSTRIFGTFNIVALADQLKGSGSRWRQFSARLLRTMDRGPTLESVTLFFAP